MGNNRARTDMKKSFYIVASLVLACILFAGCKKWIEEPEPKEDLSYLIKTYYRYESNGKIIKDTWTYDGYKPTGHQHYEDDQLKYEYKNYSYDGLNVSRDFYQYQNNEVEYYTHSEAEYLDETFLRTKYKKEQFFYPKNPQNNYIVEYYCVYDGKKIVSTKHYHNNYHTETHCDYDGLRCSEKITFYNSQEVIFQVKDIDIMYLDDTYKREKSYRNTTRKFDASGNLLHSETYYYVFDYEGKKPIGYQFYSNGELSSVYRDYHYDGLSCYYFVDSYQDGEVISTRIDEVEYLE